MNKDTAKDLVKRLKTKSLKHFALAANGEHPILLVDKVKLTPALVKTQAEERLGVTYRGGALFTGTLERDGSTTIFVVDEQASVGNLDTKKAVLTLRKLKQDLAGQGQKADTLNKFEIRMGDVQERHDTRQDAAAGGTFGTTLDTLLERLNAQAKRAAAVSHATATPPNLTMLEELNESLEDATQTLSTTVREARDTLKVELHRLGGKVPGEHADLHTLVQGKIDGLFQLLDPAKSLSRTTKLEDVARPIPVPPNLDKKGSPVPGMLADLNEAVRAGEIPVRDLAKQAWALADACATRLKALRGKWRKDKDQMAALQKVLREAEGMALLLQARAASSKAMVVGKLFDPNEGGQEGRGVNNARFVKQDGTSKFLVKVYAYGKETEEEQRAYRDKTREFGSEVGASAMSGMLCTALGLPQMVTPTFATLLKGPNGPCMSTVQDVWPDAQGMDERYVHHVEVKGRKFELTPGDVIIVRARRDRALVGALTGILGEEAVRGLEPEDFEELRRQADQQRIEGRLVDLFGMDDEKVADDLAGIAILDILTGQRDHRAGKQDNLMAVTIDGEKRVRPIDFGMSMLPPTAPTVDELNFAAWSEEPTARRPIKPQLLRNLIDLELGMMFEHAKATSRDAAIATGEPGMEISDDAIEVGRFQGQFLQDAVIAAVNAKKSVSPRDLAQLMSVHLRPSMTKIKNAATANQPWKDLMEEERKAFPGLIEAWLLTLA